MDEQKHSPFKRFIGKVKQQQGQYGSFLKMVIDSPSPVKYDKATDSMVEDSYNKGVLIWCDNETGKKYLVKQFTVHGVGKETAARGYTNSFALQLDDEYQVQELP